jgi:hypothetical protein
MYHEWCCRFVFEASTTCVAAGCGAEMHEGWWACSGFVKPGASGCLVNSEDRGTGKTSAQPHAGQYLALFLFVIEFFVMMR